MMHAPVRIIPLFREARKALGLTPLDQKRIRALLTLNPLRGSLAYPIMAVRSLLPHAGIYEREDEFRLPFGAPVMMISRYLFVDRRMPLYAAQLFAATDKRKYALTLAHMQLADRVASAMA